MIRLSLRLPSISSSRSRFLLLLLRPPLPIHCSPLFRYQTLTLTSYQSLIQSFTRLSLHGPLSDAMAVLETLDSRRLQAADPVDYLNLIKLCISAGASDAGRLIQHHLTSIGYLPVLFLSNSLLGMYARFKLIEDARQLFEALPLRNVVSWTTLISALIDIDQSNEALVHFLLMQRDGIRPNMYTFSSVIRACNTLRILGAMHCCVIKHGFESDDFVRSSLIDIYFRVGDSESGCLIFDGLITRDLVVWNSVIGGLAQTGNSLKSLEVFRQMKRSGFVANQAALTSALRACTGMVFLEMGQQIHVHLLKYKADLILNNAILDMYSKCGSLDEAESIFQRMPEKDVISWSTMISGLAQNGRSLESLRLFDLMKAEGPNPSYITLVGVLFACSHAGLVEDGWYYFRSMKRLFDIEPGMEHYGCMVDLLGRAGKLEEAVNFIQEMVSNPDTIVWRALLGACRAHKNVSLATYAAEKILKLKPGDEGTCILLSNIYADAKLWSGVERVRKMMRERGIQKEPGRSWMDVGMETHTFIAGDFSHPQMDGIHRELERLFSRIRALGYAPHTEFVLHDLGIEQKEESLRYHGEKMAIAFGMMNSTDGKPVRIMKNLKICGDCHAFAKLVSRSEGKVIVIRDLVRFHHFQDGACSCGDYW